MVALKLRQFGGTIPAVDVHLLPDNHAEVSDNTWLYSGAIAGLHQFVDVHTLVNPTAKKVFRIPKEYYDKDHIVDSYWLEFEDPDTDVISSPTIEDQFERFYWASYALGAFYNTKARIIAGSPAYKLGIPAPTYVPIISRVNGKFYFSCDSAAYSVRGGHTHLYLTENYGLDYDSFINGEVAFDNPGSYGASTAYKTVGGVKVNVDNSPIFEDSFPANQYTVVGSPASLRYGTTVLGQRITISDEGQITIGVPAQMVNAPEYVGEGVLETRAYVYTWVSAYGEEGPPSPPALATAYSGDPWYIRVTAPSAGDTADRNLTKTRIYRTVTGVGGSTTYFLVAEIDINVTSYEDRTPDNRVTDNAILESTFWSAPPSDLAGMVTMPNGIVAGFRENEIWFSEPYRPHAWPGAYAIAVDTPIVGMGVVGQTLIVLTNTAPYAVTGINPASMSVSRLKQVEPCLSRGSIVSTTAGVAYVSPNGLAIATTSEVQILTRQMVGKDRWLDLIHAPTFRACSLNGAYYGWGSVSAGCFETTAFETATAFVSIDYSGAYSGALVDVNDNRIAFNTLSTLTPTYNCFADVWTGEALVIKDGKVCWLDVSEGRPHQSYTWKSKVFEMPNMRSLEAMRIWYRTFDDTPTQNPVPVVSPSTLAADMHGIVKVYADGRLVFSREMRSSGEFMRLPSGFKATYWQIELQARVLVLNIEAATTAKELLNV